MAAPRRVCRSSFGRLWTGRPDCSKPYRANADGRTDQPLLGPDEFKAAIFELVFYVGEYFAKKTAGQAKAPFLDQVPVRFGVTDVNAAYHVPLLVSPWAYSTYRGS